MAPSDEGEIKFIRKQTTVWLSASFELIKKYILLAPLVRGAVAKFANGELK